MINEASFAPEADARGFRTALGRFATGVTIVTTMGHAGPIGFTANSFAAVSLDPALVLWSPAKSASRHDLFANAAHFAIHVLAADQSPLAARFLRGGPGFDDLAHDISPEGTPTLRHTLARFDCAHHVAHDGGDHTIVLARVLRAAYATGAPLVFSQGSYGGFAA